LFSGAKHKHQAAVRRIKGKAINDKVRLYSKLGQALLEAQGKRQRTRTRHRGGDSLGTKFTESVSGGRAAGPGRRASTICTWWRETSATRGRR